MTSGNPFETMAAEYDAWFDTHPTLFESELRAIRAVLPPRSGSWVEIGVGTGRFAAALGLRIGLEPATAMAERARERGVHVFPGTAEHLPWPASTVDGAFFITTLCFVSDVAQALSEAHRVLLPGGFVVAAILPRDSELGRRIAADRTDPFFRMARLLTLAELEDALDRTGFAVERRVATLADPSAAKGPEEPRQAPSEGSFVVVRARRCDSPRPPCNLDRMNPTSVASSP